jgi:hypothetical protein
MLEVDLSADGSNSHVLGVLEDVANQLSLLKQVADKEIDEKLQ